MALGHMSPLRAHLRWRAQRLGQFARYSLLRRVYRETNHDIGNSLIVAGAARSGTTWLADIIQSQLDCRLMFEPFHSGKVAAFHGHHYFQYMRPEEKCPTLYDYSKRVLSGDIRHAWVDRRVDRLRSHYRLVKEIRANLFLKWLADAFPQVPILFIIRHPCAVVLSRMKLDWATDSDIAPFLAQPKLVEDYLSDKLDFINGIEAAESKHALIWCVSNLVPIRQFGPGNLNIVFYENLVARPEAEIDHLFGLLRLDYDRQRIMSQILEPSTTTLWERANLSPTEKIGGWKDQLNHKQIGDIMSVVREFGMDDLYNEDVMPRFGAGMERHA